MSKWRMSVIDIDGNITYENVYSTKAAAIEDGYRAMEVDEYAENYRVEEISDSKE